MSDSDEFDELMISYLYKQWIRLRMMRMYTDF